MEKGDLVLVPFPFTDLSNTKNRPALVLVSTNQSVTLSFITTKIRWQEAWDVVLPPTEENGLKKTSLVRLSKITTLDKSLIIGKLGQLSPEKITFLNNGLRMLLDL